MNRRGFLGMIGGLLVSEAIPFNRVWSFPSKIVIPTGRDLKTALQAIDTMPMYMKVVAADDLIQELSDRYLIPKSRLSIGHKGIAAHWSYFPG